MDQATIWMGIFIMVTIVVLRLPSTIAMNQGKIIRNTALWLAVVTALALFYHLFGPFKMAMNTLPANRSTTTEQQEDNARPNLKDDSDPLIESPTNDKKKTERDL